MKIPIFQTFNICENYILYEPIVNKFYYIPLELYEFLEELNGIENLEDIPLEIKSKHKKGYENFMDFQKYYKCLLENKFPIPKYPYTNEQVAYMLTHHQKQIVLEMTKACNFRCKYCILSDIYSNESQYSYGEMPKEILKKSIDFFINNSSDSDSLAISFYGGEPFLCYENIKWCVEYANKNIIAKKINFNVTTNGSLLTEDIIEFLVANDFKILFSLDGPKKIHDFNRVFGDGRPTYESIKNKLDFIKYKYPTFFEKNITFHAVISNSKLTNEVIGFLANEFNNNFNYSFVQPGYDVKKFNALFMEDKKIYSKLYEQRDFYKETIQQIQENPFIENSMTNLYDKDVAEIFQMKPRRSNESLWPGGTCDIGSRRIFVDVNGNIYPCEKVSYNDMVNCIGNVIDGFNLPKILDIIHDYEQTLYKCRYCWCANLCKRCWKQKEIDDSYCEDMKKAIKKQIADSLKILIESPNVIKRYDKVELR